MILITQINEMNSQILMLLKFNLQFLNKEQNFEYLNLNQCSQDLRDILKIIINDIINKINQEEVYNIIKDCTTKQYQQHVKTNFDKKSSNHSIPMNLSITNPGCDTKSIIDCESFISIQDGPAGIYPDEMIASNFSKVFNRKVPELFDFESVANEVSNSSCINNDINEYQIKANKQSKYTPEEVKERLERIEVKPYLQIPLNDTRYLINNQSSNVFEYAKGVTNNTIAEANKEDEQSYPQELVSGLFEKCSSNNSNEDMSSHKNKIKKKVTFNLGGERKNQNLVFQPYDRLAKFTK